MEFILQLAIILVCLFYGARKGGMALGLLGGIGIVILAFVFKLPPGKPPVDVMLTIIAVVADTVFDANLPGLKAMLSDVVKVHPWAYAIALPVVSKLVNAQAAAIAALVGVPFEVVVTSERAGFYKPDPRPYQLPVRELELTPDQVLFVAGSAYDLFGTSQVGLDTYWHNRAGLTAPPGAPRPLLESRTLTELPPSAMRHS
jgi:beta-phosphoglucomutase-like phosphatase (HAD superfamily)